MSVFPSPVPSIDTDHADLDAAHAAARPLDVDVAIGTHPADARRAAATAIGRHIAAELRAGRSLFNVIHDDEVADRLGADGRAWAVRAAEAGA